MDKVGRHIHQVQDAIDRLVPVLQHELLVLNRPEVNHTVNTVDSAGDDVLVVKSAQLLLAVLSLYLQQLAYSSKSKFSVVFADDADVMLHQHPF